jgi:hypothetical protein
MGVALNWPPNLLQRMYRQLMALLEIKVKATATPPYITMLECTLIPATEQNGGEDVGGVVQFPPKVLR